MVNMDSRYNVKWNNFHSALEMGFYELLEKETMVDVTLIADGRYLKAHKIILSISSLYFQEIFEAHPCPHPFIILKDVQYQELENMLNFMYRGEVEVPQENLASFLKLAETLKVKNFFIGDKQENNVDVQLDSSHLQKSLSQVCVKTEAPEIELDDSETEEVDNNFVEETIQTKQEKSPNAKATKLPMKIYRNPRVHLVRLPDQRLHNYLQDDNKYSKDLPRSRLRIRNLNTAELSRAKTTEQRQRIRHQQKKRLSSSSKHRPANVLWEYFQKHTLRSVCKECGHIYRGHKNTTVCKHHLKTKHPELFKTYMEKVLQRLGPKGYQSCFFDFPNVGNK